MIGFLTVAGALNRTQQRLENFTFPGGSKSCAFASYIVKYWKAPPQPRSKDNACDTN